MSKRCLIVINNLSGGSEKLSREKVLQGIGAGYDTDFFCINTATDTYDTRGYDRIVVCGGDGTLHHAINSVHEGAELLYYPCGTFNELYKNNRHGGEDFVNIPECGRINGVRFGYVAACGIFTPLGYTVDGDDKKKLKIVAYLARVLREYRVADIPAVIRADEICREDSFTLIMLIKSSRCFGLTFNKMFKPNDGQMQLLCIKSFGRDSISNRIKTFFPLFRVFFGKLRHEVKTDNILFVSAKSVGIQLKSDKLPYWCVDGERAELARNIGASITPLPFELKVLRPR